MYNKNGFFVNNLFASNRTRQALVLIQNCQFWLLQALHWLLQNHVAFCNDFSSGLSIEIEERWDNKRIGKVFLQYASSCVFSNPWQNTCHKLHIYVFLLWRVYLQSSPLKKRRWQLWYDFTSKITQKSLLLLHFLLFEIFIFCQKIQRWFREKPVVFFGWKTRENVVVLDF